VAVAAPLSSQVERRRVHLPGVFVYWHLLSLDAPTVAVVWAWSFARTLRVGASASAIAVLGIGTWMIYVTDRLLDACWADDAELRERHFFHEQHRRAFLVALGASAIVLAWLIAILPAPARVADAIVFAASMLYFAAAHSPRSRLRSSIAREFAVGVVFASAVAVPAWSSTPARSALIIPAALLAGLCTLNCVAIETWEKKPGVRSSRSIRLIAATVAIAAIACCLVPQIRNPGQIRLASAVLVSALLLPAMDAWARKRIREAPPETAARLLLALRIAADVALLTPLLFVIP
jgi:hypothetical protein